MRLVNCGMCSDGDCIFNLCPICDERKGIHRKYSACIHGRYASVYDADKADGICHAVVERSKAAFDFVSTELFDNGCFLSIGKTKSREGENALSISAVVYSGDFVFGYIRELCRNKDGTVPFSSEIFIVLSNYVCLEY